MTGFDEAGRGPQRVAAWLAGETGSAVFDLRSAGGGHGARHYLAELSGGRKVFVKEAGADPGAAADAAAGGRGGAAAADAGRGGAAAVDAGRGGGAAAVDAGRGGGAAVDAAGRGEAGHDALVAEARGLRWLGEARQVPVPEVIAASPGLLAIDWVPPGAGPDRMAAERFGRELALLHLTGAERFGAPWPGFIASLPLPNDQSDAWPSWYAQRRLLPYCRIASDAGTLRPDDVALVEDVAGRLTRGVACAGFGEPPRRIHGDLWSGNLLWSGGRGWLIDPAAHGGHRESDLAMLALFGAPHLDRIVAAYQEVAPLADGWRERLPLHQLHPLLVHVCLFGESYRASALAAARAALSALPA